MGTLTQQINTLSKKKVTIVFPPERKVKYAAWRKACAGINTAVTIMKYLASSLDAGFVLYNCGNKGAITNITSATPVQHITENTIILRSVSFASSIFPAPKSCPTTIATESPKAINTTLNRLEMVFEIFIPATTFIPLTE